MLLMLRPPKPDPSLDVFRDGVAVLRREGQVAGHVATSVRTFWAPLSFSRRRQWWVWYIVIWANGDREQPGEDYPPWTVVQEMQSGIFSWDEDGARGGTYEVGWLTAAAREQALAKLNIGPGDF